MRDFANKKYELFQKLWTEFDYFSVVCAIITAFWLLVHFWLYGVLDSSIRIAPIAVGLVAFFYVQILTGFNILFGYW